MSLIGGGGGRFGRKWEVGPKNWYVVGGGLSEVVGLVGGDLSEVVGGGIGGRWTLRSGGRWDLEIPATCPL